MASTPLESLYSKQIAWAAANIENPEVVRQFRVSFRKLLTDKTDLTSLQTGEGPQILQQGKNLLRAMDLQEKLQQCALEQSNARSIRDLIGSALGQQALTSPACDELAASTPKIFKFSRELEAHLEQEARDQMIAIAQSQLQQTQNYWAESEKQDATNLALDLTERELDIKTNPPKAGTELLLYTQALQNRKNKTFVTKVDVKNAFSEIRNELQTNKDYLQEMNAKNPSLAIRRLLKTNPGAAAQYLIAHPEAMDLICKNLQALDQKQSIEDALDKTFFWGGMVIAGVLIVSGVGALAGGALAGTLATVAAGTAIAGTVTATGDVLYTSSKAQESYVEMQNIRSSVYAEGLSTKGTKRIDEAHDKVQSDLMSAGFSAVSVVPFGAGFKVMKNVAKAARSGAKAEVEATKSLTTAFKEIADNKPVLKALEAAQSKVPEEEMGEFLGYLSSLSPSEKARVYALIKAKPDKLPEAIREASKSGVCK